MKQCIFSRFGISEALIFFFFFLLRVYCELTTDGRGWTLIARFSNNDVKNWMADTGTELLKMCQSLTKCSQAIRGAHY